MISPKILAHSVAQFQFSGGSGTGEKVMKGRATLVFKPAYDIHL